MISWLTGAGGLAKVARLVSLLPLSREKKLKIVTKLYELSNR